MKNSKKVFVLIEVVMGVMVILVAAAMLREKNGEERGKVSVIIHNSEDSQWVSFKYGLRMAAQDHQTEVFVVSTDGILSEEEEKEAIDREIQNGADAVIVQPVPGADMKKMLKNVPQKVSVILVESQATEGEGTLDLPTVKPDNFAIGKALGEELVKDYNGNLKGKTLGIISENRAFEAVEDREEGFRSVADAMGARTVWDLSDLERGEGAEHAIERQEKVDFVIALDNYSVISAGKAAAKNNLHGALVYGIGNSTEAIYYLDTGRARSLVVPDEFNVGYQSFTEAAESLGSIFKKPENRTVSFTVLWRDNLFSRENQEFLFTMSQ